MYIQHSFASRPFFSSLWLLFYVQGFKNYYIQLSRILLLYEDLLSNNMICLRNIPFKIISILPVSWNVLTLQIIYVINPTFSIIQIFYFEITQPSVDTIDFSILRINWRVVDRLKILFQFFSNCLKSFYDLVSSLVFF